MSLLSVPVQYVLVVSFFLQAQYSPTLILSLIYLYIFLFILIFFLLFVCLLNLLCSGSVLAFLLALLFLVFAASS
jgi:signal transduction histidine kinase